MNYFYTTDSFGVLTVITEMSTFISPFKIINYKILVRLVKIINPFLVTTSSGFLYYLTERKSPVNSFARASVYQQTPFSADNPTKNVQQQRQSMLKAMNDM